MNEYLFTRKYQGKEYKFYRDSINFNGAEESYYKVKTPENCFGYSDTILFTTEGRPYTLHRYLPPWILKKCKKALLKRGYKL